MGAGVQQGPEFQIGGQTFQAKRWPTCGEVIDMSDALEVYDRDKSAGLKQIIALMAAFLEVDESVIRAAKPKEVQPMLHSFFRPEPEDETDGPTP